jgi:hypothetical protein
MSQYTRHMAMATYTNHADVKCLKCGGPTNYHSFESACEKEDCDSKGCWSSHNADEDWYICPSCQCLHLPCPKCAPTRGIVLCRFLGHPGDFKDPLQQVKDIQRFRGPRLDQVEMPVDEREQLEVHLEIIRHKAGVDGTQVADRIEYLDAAATAQWILDLTNSCKDLVVYYVGDKHLYFADPNEVWLTGPDGGFGHGWKCDHCESVYDLTDK